MSLNAPLVHSMECRKDIPPSREGPAGGGDQTHLLAWGVPVSSGATGAALLGRDGVSGCRLPTGRRSSAEEGGERKVEGSPPWVRATAPRPCARLDPRQARTGRQPRASAARLRGGGPALTTASPPRSDAGHRHLGSASAVAGRDRLPEEERGCGGRTATRSGAPRAARSASCSAAVPAATAAADRPCVLSVRELGRARGATPGSAHRSRGRRLGSGGVAAPANLPGDFAKTEGV